MDLASSPALRFVRRVVPLTSDPSSGRFIVKTERGRLVTPLGLALVALAVADLTFAVDSVSASFGITTDFLVIWFANAFALFGLVPLLALVRALASRFRYVGQTFAAILAFIALRLLTEDVVEIGPLASLAGIAGILAAGVIASVIADRLANVPEPERAERRPPRIKDDRVVRTISVSTGKTSTRRRLAATRSTPRSHAGGRPRFASDCPGRSPSSAASPFTSCRTGPPIRHHMGVCASATPSHDGPTRSHTSACRCM
jgi:hypothetical protein